jgi:hypothetical protein
MSALSGDSEVAAGRAFGITTLDALAYGALFRSRRPVACYTEPYLSHTDAPRCRVEYQRWWKQRVMMPPLAHAAQLGNDRL